MAEAKAGSSRIVIYGALAANAAIAIAKFVAAGITGGFPVGGSFSRSALNRMAGARTRWSGSGTSCSPAPRGSR